MRNQHVNHTRFILHSSGTGPAGHPEPDERNIKREGLRFCLLTFDIQQVRLRAGKPGAGRLEYTTREDNMLTTRVLYSTRLAPGVQVVPGSCHSHAMSLLRKGLANGTLDIPSTSITQPWARKRARKRPAGAMEKSALAKGRATSRKRARR